MANDPRRGLMWRAAWLLAVILVIILWRGCLGGPRYVIQVQFGMDPEFLTGAEVVIDGTVAGTLGRIGSRTVNGFEVEEGEHTVEVRREGCEADPVRITSGFGGTTVMLIAEPDSNGRGAEESCVIRLQY